MENQSKKYRRKAIEQKLKDYEAALGRKQMEIDLLNKPIDLANEDYHMDLKKTYQGCTRVV
ncbi:MAG: hypothetical protein K9H16_09085 [Bacteroidales bacterium]|nr:hypothetical protein [Bacteroidales bacterium]